METNYWLKRFREADQAYDTWANTYLCNILEEYYRGKQWNLQLSLGPDNRPYTLNLVYSTIKIKLANYLVNTPYIIAIPKAIDASYDLERSLASAQRKEAYVNTIIQNPHNKFSFNLKKCIRDGFFRFGIMEVAYSGSFIENPKASRPEWTSDQDRENFKDRIITKPEVLTESEHLFFKRISPKNFRVSERSEDSLELCDWYGYYDYAGRSDFEKATGTKIGSISSAEVSGEGKYDHEENVKNVPNAVKYWKVWDNKSRKKYIVLDSDGEIYHEEPFSYSPIVDFRWDLDFDGFYPIPPVYHWLSQQDEINEAREQARNHRKRFVRKFQVGKGVFSHEELSKFNHGPDGTVIEMERVDNPGIVPIANADLGAQALQSLSVTREDFNIISGTSSEARGVADRQTATQAQIIENRSNVRETADTEEVNTFITEVARLAIITAGDRLTLPVMVESTDKSTQLYQEFKPETEYKMLNPADLNDGYEFKLLVDVSSTSPAQNEVEKTKFIEFISILKNFPELAMSPLLIREAAYKVGYRNERVIREMQNAALLQMMAAQGGGGPQQGGGQESAGGTGEMQRVSEQNTPPTQDDINNQLNNQLVQ